MYRDTRELTGRPFDVLVIGAGAAGAAAAREACLRGFDTALIEREDFGSGTSAHCFKVVHGGIRYLQHADITRLRASCRERAVLLHIAPHLVAPMPFVVPTYGQGRRSKWLLGAGMHLYDALSADCNSYVQDPSRRIEKTSYLDRGQTLRLFPFLSCAKLTGAAVFEDGQMYSPPRLVLAFVSAAHELGAKVANYVEAVRFLMRDSRVTGVMARDRLSGEDFEIRARVVINAAGPWAEGLLATLEGQTPLPAATYSRDAYVLLDREATQPFALAVQGSVRDADALIARGARHLLLVPWRDRLLLGVWHRIVPRDPDAAALSGEELALLMDELNQSLPELQINECDVRMTGFGLVPFGEAAIRHPRAVSFGKRSRLIDHRAQGIQGLLSLLSVRFTVARADGEEALSLVEEQLAPRGALSESRTRPLPGGDIVDFSRFTADLRQQAAGWLTGPDALALARNYGSRAPRVIALAEHNSSLKNYAGGSRVTFAEVAYAVREEMAQRMSDVVFRRTDLGTAGHPGRAALDQVQDFMRRACGWTAQRAAEERAATDRHFTRYLAAELAQPAAVRSA
jgi:glycerol-3-phosphate dehydrogenase